MGERLGLPTDKIVRHREERSRTTDDYGNRKLEKSVAASYTGINKLDYFAIQWLNVLEGKRRLLIFKVWLTKIIMPCCLIKSPSDSLLPQRSGQAVLYGQERDLVNLVPSYPLPFSALVTLAFNTSYWPDCVLYISDNCISFLNCPKVLSWKLWYVLSQLVSPRTSIFSRPLLVPGLSFFQ